MPDSNAGHEPKFGLEWWTIGIGVACGYTIYSYRNLTEKAGGRDGHEDRESLVRASR